LGTSFGSLVKSFTILNMKQNFILGFILASVFVIMAMGVWKILPKQRVEEAANIGLGTRKISIVTSFYPLYFFASELGGDRSDVKNITPAGVEPHDYEPTARDVIDIQNSNLLILNGGGFEAWGAKIKGELSNDNVKVVEAGEGLFVNNDPHVWLSPEVAKSMIKNILLGMIKSDPENEAYYTRNMINLVERLEKLQKDYVSGLMTCQSRDVVVSHEAFEYLAKEFNLEQIAISGLSPEEEPSTKKLVEISKFIKEKGIKYIFFETLVSPKLAETIANEVGAKTLVLNPLEGLSEDEQGKKNYFTIMEDNLANLRIALECQ